VNASDFGALQAVRVALQVCACWCNLGCKIACWGHMFSLCPSSVLDTTRMDDLLRRLGSSLATWATICGVSCSPNCKVGWRSGRVGVPFLVAVCYCHAGLELEGGE